MDTKVEAHELQAKCARLEQAARNARDELLSWIDSHHHKVPGHYSVIEEVVERLTDALANDVAEASEVA